MAPDHAPTPPPEVACIALAKTFPGGTEAVRPLDLSFAAGQTTALVGPSGCGKSTVLRLVAGLESPSAGRIEIAGAPPAETLRRAGLSVAFQDPSLLPWRSVRGNIELALGLARRPVEAGEVDQLIRLVGLDGFAETRPAELSGGMRQRAAIARALATRPGLLLLDEPFGAVDELTRRQLAQDLPRIWEARGTTTLLVTHSVTEAVALSDRVIVLSPRPAEVVADIAIDLPRPRPEGVAQTDAAMALIEQVFAALSEGMARRQRPLAAQ
ncbi:ATPase (plasmid) [Dinoroseobacter shibae DFL 12 = DSM 16493]|jgi:NitT/TauT family transport system ATP-binding protein|uniref:ATPase n=1 Tax=Dinoroseobacter shibae (strain DSM 16493 / NCIMB 14021 / DFL 12) TaxID=398580 RepID=A8LUF7_DINSH|nr:ABC transporter ATP-binding protein [Dinoroseobacter shibae]ABV95874.1 ATPase [Dinoroseobacter shibae DFL 12 = DSM 16493]URF49189.1 ABC transporter ATP-binding protein [Dinoroseobacter shibae]URF53497.1 ABC transporter ATP-binding protein [Dinoroseobacter shibae]